MLTGEELETRDTETEPEPGSDPGAAQRPPVPEGWLAPIDRRVAAVVALVGVVCAVGIQLLTPAAADPEVATTWYVALTDLVYWTLALAAVAGLAMGQRYGVVAAYWNAVVLGAAVIACPATGHHTFGVWWLGQMTAAIAFAVVAAGALRLTRPAPEPVTTSR